MRGVILVIDAFGIGAAPDAEAYGDGGSHTLRSVCAAATSGSQVTWPQLLAMGLGNCAALSGAQIANCAPVAEPLASYGIMAEKSAGKDTTTGHWELAGIVLEHGFSVFPSEFPSFPKTLVDRFERRTGYRLIGNRAASGTAIIEQLGAEQMQGSRLICYTSADSVLQIAAHEAVVSLEQLYEACRVAREICNDYNVARVIARPFTGRPGSFVRTTGRRDYSIDLPGPTVLDELLAKGVETVGIGKIGDIFKQQGLAVSHADKGNAGCLQRLAAVLAAGAEQDQLVFVNLVDTDMNYGHRRDPPGYYRAIREIDDFLPRICEHLNREDFLIITADHGCDPGFTGSDHTREYVPLLFFQPGRKPKNLGVRQSFADVAATVAVLFGIENRYGMPALSA